MGSEIKLESEINKGSVFSFELEFEESESFQEDTIAFDEVIGYKGDRRRILIVDDNLLNRILFDKMLRRLGFIIDQAENGKELIKYQLGEDYYIETGIEFGRLYRRNNEWKFDASGVGYKEDLAFFLSKYFSGTIQK